MHNLDIMISKIAEYKSTLRYYDKYLYNVEFNGDFISSQPFYVWKNKYYGNKISDFLSGQKIIMKADIRKSLKGKDAIKFNKIEIKVKAKDESIQSEINNKLKSYTVSLKHFGNSYYRYNYKFYQITTESQNIIYSFEKKNDKPIKFNNVYSKILEGDISLSPYAMWEIQLIPFNQQISHHNLEIYKNDVDLELIGTGSYMDFGTSNITFNMDYYEVYDPIDIEHEIKCISIIQ